ncbi:1-aminocyclopropane-1-carboxylate oxidase [Cocos nucifera]|uniref:1-aminocyclopropane-1-carboxylate oxidase n=1 Tax=Cocos nucifera TaxID=13894 RepID=A0A8K0IWT6_COCNU|nr:1-aminocyclopropane-1-carboxylate oxidase [Cocos nucifera]
MAIPVIDFSKLDGKERIETLAKIANGCEEWGFFQLVNHGIPVELLERVKEVCSECYKLRQEGFKESMPVQLLNKLVLDEEMEGGTVKRKTMMEYRKEVKKLAEKVMEAMDENLGLEKGYIKKAFSGSGEHEPFFGTKVSHYPPCPRPDLVDGLRAHTDAGGVILLFQDDRVGGLQILKHGRWIDVQPLENAIVINTGDQIEVVSNGRYKSVWHRVLATPDGNRRSVASFYNPSFKAMIAPAVTKGAEACASYPKFVFGDYMDVYVKRKFEPKEPRFEAVAAM